MKVVAMLIALSSSALAAMSEPPVLLEPTDGAVTTMTVPHFRWRGTAPATPEAMGAYDIQIAAGHDFAAVEDEDRIAAVIARYVPDRELATGDHWWRVAAVDQGGRRGAWSEPRRFTVHPPERVFPVPAAASFVDIRRVLADAAAHAPARVVFEKADRRLDPAGAGGFIALTNATDLVIDGGGGTFTFSGFLKFVSLRHAKRVIVRNFSFDFDPLPYTAARVLSVDPKAGTFDAEVEPGHPLLESNPHFARDHNGMIVDASVPRMKRGVDLILSNAGWQSLGGRRYRFTAENRRGLGTLAPGDVYVLDPRIATGFDVDGGDEVVFLNLVAYAISNEGFNSHYGNRHSILHCGIRLRPGRFIAANNGGHNHHSARIGPWIEGCTWENTGDDICHVNGLVMGVSTQVAPDRVRLPLRNPYDAVGADLALDVQPGDLLRFFNRSVGRLAGERRVVAAHVAGSSLEVTLDGGIDGLVPGRPGSPKRGSKSGAPDDSITQVFDASRTCNEFVFRNNTVRNGRRVGVLAKGAGGVVENNTFEGLGGGAVEFWNAPFEGLGASDYVVRGNRIRDCGVIAREDAAIWATIFRSGAGRYHERLTIEDNEITGFPGTAILLRDVNGGVVRNNRIVPAGGPGSAAGEPVILLNTQDVRVEPRAAVR